MSSAIPTKKNFITKESAVRLMRDVHDIMSNPLTSDGIYYVHDDEDLLRGYAMIMGPSDTPYFGGYYFFEFTYPTDYPHSPPTANYMTNGDNIRFNPNLYVNGKVCISLLNTWRGEQWTSCQTISTVLLNLCTLLIQNPLLNEPGVSSSHPDLKNYTRIIEFKNIEIAILRMVTRNPSSFNDKFNVFYPFVKENFFKNVADIEKFIIEKCNTDPNKEKVQTTMYMMTVVIDYPKLKIAFDDVVRCHI
jgi:ubiquitin-conjugating enzyme E2 Z